MKKIYKRKKKIIKIKNGNSQNKEENKNNNKTKNEKFSKFYNYPKFKSRNTSFIFKPIINNKSKILASKMKTNSTERLFTLSLKEKQNLNSIFLKRKNEMEISLKTEKERKRFKMNNNTYKPNVKNNKRKELTELKQENNYIKFQLEDLMRKNQENNKKGSNSKYKKENSLPLFHSSSSDKSDELTSFCSYNLSIYFLLLFFTFGLYVLLFILNLFLSFSPFSIFVFVLFK